MKILARTASVLTFISFFVPGAWLLLAIARLNAGEEAFAVILGCFFLGLAFSLGPFLWLVGDRLSTDQNGK